MYCYVVIFLGGFELPISDVMAAVQRFPVVTTKLSNELPMVKCFQITEAEFMYKQLFEDSEYAKHGISIKKGDTIFDVGANIGMFGLHCILSTEASKGRETVLFRTHTLPCRHL